MLKNTNDVVWNFIPADHKTYARREVLKVATHALRLHSEWMEDKAEKLHQKTLKDALKALGVQEI